METERIKEVIRMGIVTLIRTNSGRTIYVRDGLTTNSETAKNALVTQNVSFDAQPEENVSGDIWFHAKEIRIS